MFPLSILSLMYDRYTKPPSWRNLAKRPTPQRGSRDAAECADAGCTGATGTRGYGGCAGAAVLGCGRGVPLKTAVESSPWTERGAPKSALTHQKQTPFFSSSGKSKSTNAPWVLFSEHAWLTWISTITSHTRSCRSRTRWCAPIQFNSSKLPTLARVGTTQNLGFPPAVRPLATRGS